MARNTRWAEYATIAALTLLYLLLPTRNSTLDAWYYAACVRHGHELLLAHHLLYNAAGWLWYSALQTAGPVDALAALKVLNALAAGASLLVVLRLLRLLTPPGSTHWPWLLLVGSSFGVLRFATENEAYVQPLLLSLLASLAWVRYQLSAQQSRHLVGAGLWAALACLFHQIHFFWWLGLLLGTVWYAPARVRSLLAYALPALLVPAAYLAALAYWQEPLTGRALWRFVFHDYYAGTAGGSVSGYGLLLTGVNLGRTFLQVHGSTLALLRLYPALLAVVGVFMGLLGYAGLLLGRSFQVRIRQPGTPMMVVPMAAIIRTHGLVLGLHLLFATYSEGNAEFMVMVPALAVLIACPSLPWLSSRAVAATALGVLSWNLAFGVVPAHRLRITNTESLLVRIRREPASWFLLDNHNLVLNQLHYYSGQAVAPPNVLPMPTLLVRRPGQSPARLRRWLRAQHHAGCRVFTDGLGGPQLLDRAQVVVGNQNARLLQGFHTTKVDSFPTAFGPYYLTEIQ
ncbi:hypothetical protein [Hymenobacter elongatus]|uniref:Glycosyltransferase RgtA/B/C/D-like domain-containing protein n=1 Tax=Hymenobacter elongatus TaxID=877208 RepID=A0A4Z0PMW5_9BACT|nr:hypothetical protein [Hymenobacter elongatus]TGE17005.1 hypothetical protein E5J99_08435 [Hymenobacter elongatus]